MPPQQPSSKTIFQNPAVVTFLINRCALFNKIWSREQLGFFFLLYCYYCFLFMSFAVFSIRTKLLC